MSRIVYVPGFNESDSIFKSLCGVLGERIINTSLPGHPGENHSIPYSMTSTRELVEKLLQEGGDINGVITTSLSAWPVLEAVDTVNSTVKKMLLINPAYDPFMAVVRMFHANPLIDKRIIENKKPEDFLQENRAIFDTFLGGGRIHGDSKIFQNDVRRFFEREYTNEDEFLEQIRKLKEQAIGTKILFHKNDRVIFDSNPAGDTIIPRILKNPHLDIDFSLGCRTAKHPKQADYSSHIPVFSDANNDMIREFFSNN